MYVDVFKYFIRCSRSMGRFSTSFRYISDEKTKFIRDLNYENRCLYGKLLETRKQRRKSIATVKAYLKKNPEGLEVSNENGPSVLDKIKDKSSITRKKTTKKSEAHVNDSKQEEPTIGVVKNKSTKNVIHTKEATSMPTEETLTENASLKLSDKSASEADALINEQTYPLENPLKPVTSEFSVEGVISYGFNDPVVKQYAHLPSVSKIIEQTMSENNKLILSKWKKRMIKNLGEDGFDKYSTEIKSQGQEFHEAVRKSVLGCGEAREGVVGRALQSLSWVLQHVSRPMAVESLLAHPHLGYKGIPDCVAVFRDIPVVIDWKLSEKPKRDIKDTFEAPVQVTAYIGALNHDPNYKCAVNHGLVAVAYHSGEPCDVFLLSPKYCQLYWRHWLVRFDQFKARSHLHLDHDIDDRILQLK